MFDIKAEIGIPIPGAQSKKAVVRFPTDEEFTVWRRKKKVQQKDLGRRSFQIEQSKPEPIDLELYNKIRTDAGSSEIDEAEAYYVINRLADCEVSSRPEREGDSYTIQMKIMRKLTTSHTLRIPSVKEMMDYERMRSAVIFGQYGNQEIKINFQASSDLYDKLKVSTQGYLNGVPVPHKAEAINVLLQEVRAEQEETLDAGDDDQD